MTHESPGGLAALRTSLNAALIERNAEIEAMLLGIVSQEHVLLVGQPGTAKSALCRNVAAGIGGARYCERLLSPTTPPEAVFGPVSLSALREDRYEHVGQGSVTDAEIVFLDEFFRASDAIRDSLLHLLGPERQCLVGTRQVRAPLICAVGAANSWADSADQQAILDRWLIRRPVRPVSPQGREALLFGAMPTVSPVVTLGHIEAAHAASLTIPVGEEARSCLLSILDELHCAGICPSDRRCRKSVCVARAAAVIDGASEVTPAHLECLESVLWDLPEHADKAAEIVRRISNPVGARLTEILREVDEAVSGSAGSTDTTARLAACKKLEESEKEVKKLSVSGNGRAAKALAYVTRERVRLQALVFGIDPAKAEALLGGK